MTISLSMVFYLSLVCVVTALVSWCAVKLLIGYLNSKNIVDRPNERSMHTGVVPRGGGLVIVALILISTITLGIISQRFAFFAGLFACVVAWASLSWCDDRFDLSAVLRLSIQLIIAVLTVFLFGWVGTLGALNLHWFGPLLSVIGVLWMANLNNFMDGMDGLAASQAIIAGLTLAVWLVQFGDWHLAALCLVMAAASYGFLLCNWHPARIFMGDVGSVTLGGLYATLIIIVVNRHDVSVFSAVMVFAVFIGDATVTMINRIRRGEKIWLPHRSHFYQRAGLSGVNHEIIVIMAIGIMMLCSLFATLTVLYLDIIVPLVFLTALVVFLAGVCVVKTERRALSSEKHDNAN